MDNDSIVSPSRTEHRHLLPRKSRSPLRNMNTPLKPPKSLSKGSPRATPTKGSPVPLQKQHSELMARSNSLAREYAQLEQELNNKNALVEELSTKVANTERMLKALQEERRNELALYEKEIAFYKDTIADLQRKSLKYLQQLEHGRSHSHQVSQELDEKYAKLLKSVKVLQLDLELERNLKALLIDQIEYLTKERDFLIDHHNTSSSEEKAALSNATSRIASGNSVLRHDITPSAPNNATFDDDSNSDNSVHENHMLSSLAEDLATGTGCDAVDTSSPIKDHSYKEDSFMNVAQNFQFPPSPEKMPAPESRLPPSPDSDAKYRKRISLPTQLKQHDDFVLSPLKLTSNANGSYFETEGSVPSSKRSSKRHSMLKPNHSRYNSHDFVPIKVEFEQQNDLYRSASAPVRGHLNNLDEADEDTQEADRNEALRKLQGFEPSKRDSMLSSSSKRSSMYTDLNILSGDITKQEIMKLKFELQSLKLHNEKLLSYIGFELQKQKKNIKKLSSRSNLRGNMEYSDAKLIEKLRDMLIQKKRVLRSVSVNPILSTKLSKPLNLFEPTVGLGLINSPSQEDEDDDDFVFKSHFINSLTNADCDDYGFLSHHRKHSLRLFSNNTQQYLNEADAKQPKKFKSQTFAPPLESQEDLFSQFETDWEQSIDGDDEQEDGEEWESTASERSSGSEIDYAKLNTLNQLRYLIMGKEHFRRKRRSEEEPLVDETLKYKFLTVVIGITVLGLRFTAHPQQHN